MSPHNSPPKSPPDPSRRSRNSVTLPSFQYIELLNALHGSSQQPILPPSQRPLNYSVPFDSSLPRLSTAEMPYGAMQQHVSACSNSYFQVPQYAASTHIPSQPRPVAGVAGPSSSQGAPSPLDPDEMVILEDKRQRNTAASARFRIKKKQKALELERTVSDLTSRAAELEREATNLRRENTWLKEIVILKGRQNLSGKPGGKDEASSEESSDSSSGGITKGKGKGKGKQK